MRTGRPMVDQSEIIGRRFGRLVVEDVFRDYRGRKKKTIFCHCRCDCGKKTIVAKQDLFKFTKSCGCLQEEIQHHESKTRLYRIHQGIIRLVRGYPAPPEQIDGQMALTDNPVIYAEYFEPSKEDIENARTVTDCVLPISDNTGRLK